MTIDELGKRGAHHLDAADVAHEDEERDEREQQRVVHMQKRAAVCGKRHDDGCRDDCLVGEDMRDGKQGEHEKCRPGERAERGGCGVVGIAGELRGFVGVRGASSVVGFTASCRAVRTAVFAAAGRVARVHAARRLLLRVLWNSAKERDRAHEQHERCCGIRQHEQQEVGESHVRCAVEVKVLRVADGREHAAEVRGDGHHDHGEACMAWGIERAQRQQGEGDERHEGDVVRDEHAREEGEERECEREASGSAYGA